MSLSNALIAVLPNLLGYDLVHTRAVWVQLLLSVCFC